MQHYRLLFTVLLCLLFGFIAPIHAATCPTKLQQDEKGYWYSTDKPGWRSYHFTTPEITVNTEFFGGVVFSPKHKRMACVYKTSDGQWFAVVSSTHEGFKIDQQAVDDSGSKAAWQHDKEHDDYSCGRPTVTKVTSCPFELE